MWCWCRLWGAWGNLRFLTPQWKNKLLSMQSKVKTHEVTQLLQSSTDCHQLPSDASLLSVLTCNHLPLVWWRGLQFDEEQGLPPLNSVRVVYSKSSTFTSWDSMHAGMESHRRGFPKTELSTKGLLLHTEEMHHHGMCLFCFRTDKVSCLKI